MKPLLIFVAGGVTYGIEAARVFGVVPLPALVPVVGAARHVAGLFALAGTLIPVVDLEPLGDRPPRTRQHSDVVVVVFDGDRWLGILAEEVHDVRVPPAAKTVPLTDWVADPARALTPSATQVDSQIVLVADHQRLMSLADDAGRREEGPVPPAKESAAADPLDDVFAERARVLAMPFDSTDDEEQDLQLAVVRLGPETIGLHIGAVREFCRTTRITPVPCCPPHVLGQANLRGEVITVIDLSGVLRTERATTVEGEWTLAVVETAGVVAGIAIDEAITVVGVQTSKLGPPPATDSNTSYFLGTATSWLGVVTVLDLNAIFAGGALVVDEGM